MNKLGCFVAFVILLMSCGLTSDTWKGVKCELIEQILNDNSLRDVLKIDISPAPQSTIRIYGLRGLKIDCRGISGEWTYDSYPEIRPSVNTGVHRDIFLDYKQKKGIANESIVIVYISSFENYAERQTNYILEYEIRKNNGYIKLVGFSEYSD